MGNLKKIIVGMLAVLLLFDPVIFSNVALAMELTSYDDYVQLIVEAEEEMEADVEIVDDDEYLSDDLEDAEINDQDEDEEEMMDDDASILVLGGTFNPERIVIVPFVPGFEPSQILGTDVFLEIAGSSGGVLATGNGDFLTNFETGDSFVVSRDVATGGFVIGADVFASIGNGFFTISIGIYHPVTSVEVAWAQLDFSLDNVLEDDDYVDEEDEDDAEDEDEDEDEEADEEEICLDEEGYEVECPEICLDEEGYEVECEETCLDEDGYEVECEEICLDEDGYEVNCEEICLDEDGAEVDCPEVCLDEEGEEMECPEVEIGHWGDGFGPLGREGNRRHPADRPLPMRRTMGRSVGWVYSGDISINRANFLQFFHLNGHAAGMYNSAEGTVSFTRPQGNQVGSTSLAPRIDMEQDFAFTGNIFLGDVTQQGFGRRPNGTFGILSAAESSALGRSSRQGADGIAFSFHPNETRRLGSAGNGRNVGGVPNAFGFVFDTWYNSDRSNSTGATGLYSGDPIRFGGPTRTPAQLNSLSFDRDDNRETAGNRGSSGTGVPFAGFYTTELISGRWTATTYVGNGGTGQAMPQQLGNGTRGTALSATGGHTPGTLNPTNGAWHHVSLDYDAATGILTVVYTHSSALTGLRLDANGEQEPGYVPCDARDENGPLSINPCTNLEALHPGARQSFSKDISGILQQQTMNDNDFDGMVTYAFNIGAATGGSVNDQGFRILSMRYTAQTSDISARYLLDDMPNDVQLITDPHLGNVRGLDGVLLSGLESFINVPQEWAPELGFSFESSCLVFMDGVGVSVDDLNCLAAGNQQGMWRDGYIERELRNAGWFRSGTELSMTQWNRAGTPLRDLGVEGWEYVQIPFENNTGMPHQAAARLATSTMVDYYFRRSVGQINILKLDEFNQPLEGVEFEIHVRNDEGELVPALFNVHNGNYVTELEEMLGQGATIEVPVYDRETITLVTGADGRATTGTIPAARHGQEYYQRSGALPVGWSRNAQGHVLIPSLLPGMEGAGRGPARAIPIRTAREIVEIGNIPSGVYYLVETVAIGNNVVPEPIRIEVPFRESENTQVDVTIINFEARGIIEVEKQNVLGVARGAGFEYAIYTVNEDDTLTRVTFANGADRIVTGANGVASTPLAPTVTPGEVRDTEDGRVYEGVVRENDYRLPLGRYIIREIYAPFPYVVDTDWYAEVVIEFADQTVGTIVAPRVIQTNFRYPEVEIEIDSPMNPESITGTPRLDDSSVRWVIRNASGDIIREGLGEYIPASVIDGLPNGNYRAYFYEELPTSERNAVIAEANRDNPRFPTNLPESGRTGSHRDGVDFAVRGPAITASVDRPINPESITGAPSIPGFPQAVIPDEDVSWTIREAGSNAPGEYIDGVYIPGAYLPGRIVHEGTGPSVPQNIIDSLEAGNYTATFVVVDRESGLTARDDVDFEMRFPNIVVDVNRPVNPSVVTGEPYLPDTSIVTWTIRDAAGNPVMMPDENGDYQPLTGGGTRIPEFILNLLPEGDYNVLFRETDPATGLYHENDRNFRLQDPVVDINIENGVINPDSIIGTPSIPGLPDAEFGDDDIVWTIRDRDGNPVVIVDEAGNETILTGTGREIPQDVIDRLPEGDFNVIFVATDPETGRTGSNDLDFAVADPIIDITITGPNDSFDPETGYPVNPDSIVGNPSIPGLPDSEFSGEDITWTIRDRDGYPVVIVDANGNETVLTGTGRDIPRDVINSIPDGGFNVEFVVTDPETGRTASSNENFIVRTPEVGVVGNQTINPDTITGSPYIPGVDPADIDDEDITWEIRNVNGVRVAWGDGASFNVIDDETGAVVTGSMGPRNTQTGQITIPNDVLNTLRTGNYNVVIEVVDADTDETATDEWDFTISRPDADSNRPVNPDEVIVRPGNSDETTTSWTIVDQETNRPVAGGNESNWWFIDPETGEAIPDSGGVLTACPDTGNIILPPELINAIPEGDYLLVVIENHPEYGDVAEADQLLELRDPEIIASVNRPVNPILVVGTPSIPDGDVTWTLRDSDGNVIESGDGDRIPEEILNALPEGSYNAEFTVVDPETGRYGVDDVDFVVRFPGVDIEINGDHPLVPGLNPDEIIGVPTLPDSEVTWIIRDSGGDIVLSGNGPTIGRDVIMNLPEGIYEVEFREYDPETGLYDSDTDRFLRCDNAIYGNGHGEVDRERNPESAEFIPRNPGGSATWVIRDRDGNIVAEGEGLRVPGDVLIDLPDGDYTAYWTYVCPITNHPTTAPGVDFIVRNTPPSIEVDSGGNITIDVPDGGTYAPDGNGNIVITLPPGTNPDTEVILPPGWSVVSREEDADGNVIIVVSPPGGFVVEEDADGNPILRPVIRPTNPGSGNGNNNSSNESNDGPRRNTGRDIRVDVESAEMRLTSSRFGLPQTGAAVTSLTMVGIGILSTGSTIAVLKKRGRKY